MGDTFLLLYSAMLLPVSTCRSERGEKPCFQGFVLFRVCECKEVVLRLLATYTYSRNFKMQTLDWASKGLPTGL